MSWFGPVKSGKRTDWSRVPSYYYQSGQYGFGKTSLRRAELIKKKLKIPNDRLVFQIHFTRGRISQETDEIQQAVQDMEAAKRHFDTAAQTDQSLLHSPQQANLNSNVGVYHAAAGQYERAEVFHRAAIQVAEEVGSTTTSLGNILQNLGACYLWGGALDKTESVLRSALLKPNQQREGNLYTLGNLLLRRKDFAEALKTHEQVLQTYNKVLGPQHLVTAESHLKVGDILADPEFEGCSPAEAR